MSVRGYSAEGRPRLLHTVEYSWRTVSETSVVGGEVSEGRVREWKEEYLRGSEGRYKEKKDREVEKEKEKVERKEEENEVKVRIKDNKRDKTEDVQREATDSVHTLPPQVTIGVQEEDEEKDGVEDSQRTPAESLHTMSQHDAAEEEEAEEKLHEEAWEDEEIGATLTRQSNSNYHDSSTVVDPMKRVCKYIVLPTITLSFCDLAVAVLFERQLTLFARICRWSPTQPTPTHHIRSPASIH